MTQPESMGETIPEDGARRLLEWRDSEGRVDHTTLEECRDGKWVLIEDCWGRGDTTPNLVTVSDAAIRKPTP